MVSAHWALHAAYWCVSEVEPVFARLPGAVLVGAALPALVLAPAAGVPSPAGGGSASVRVVAARYEVGGLGLRVLDTVATAAVDPTLVGDDAGEAEGDLSAVVAEDPGSFGSLSFPSPPLSSASSGAPREQGLGRARVSVPAEPVPSVDEVTAALLGEADPGAARVERGGLAAGEVRSARITTAVEGRRAHTATVSEIGAVDVVGGVSRVEGAGPVEHESWAGADDAGARTTSFNLRSVTVLRTGAVLSMAGLDLSAVSDSALAEAAAALGVAGHVAGGDGKAVPDPRAALDALLAAAGVDGEAVAAAVADAPLLTLADVSASASAVARVAPDGDVLTSALTRGSVGSMRVGSVEVGGFEVEGTVSDWNALEEATRSALNSVLSSFGDEFVDIVQVRVMPRLTRQTDLVDGAAGAHAELALLQVLVDPPSAVPSPTPQPPGAGGVIDELPDLPDLPAGVGTVSPDVTIEVPSGGLVDGLLGRSGAAAVTVVVGEMEARAEHRRPGVTPDCSACAGGSGDTVNRVWDPDGGFGAPLSDGPGFGGALPAQGTVPLPKTGTYPFPMGVGAATFAAALLLRRFLPRRAARLAAPRI
jgi:hypothetical protein